MPKSSASLRAAPVVDGRHVGHNEHAAGGDAAQNVANVQLPLTADLPVPFRPCLPPSPRAKYLGAVANSTRLIPLHSTGRGFGAHVSGKETPDGKRRHLSPPANVAAWDESDAQRELRQYRERSHVIATMALIDWLMRVARGGGR